jgi:phenylalanyl-tRNA synthetase beta chain
VIVRRSRVDGILGVAVPAVEADRITKGLGFETVTDRGDEVTLTIPTWRNDVAREVDVVEEIGRHFGLGRIPSSLPPADSAAGLSLAQRRERRVRDTLVGAGLTEIVNLSFVRAGVTGEAVRLRNPLSEDQSILRSSLVVPGLVETLATNLRQGRRDLALFEIGRVFEPAAHLPKEARHLGLLLSGSFVEGHWSSGRRASDFFDTKGLLEAVAERLGLEITFRAGGDLPSHLHPGQSAQVLIAGQIVGTVGALHPELRSGRDLREDVMVAEIDLDPLLLAAPRTVRYAPIVRFPTVDRDISVLCSAAVSAADVLATVRGAAGPLLRSSEVTSRFDRAPVPEGFVSLTIRLRFQDPSRTLTGEEVVEAVESIIRALRESGADVRGE